MFTSDEKLEPTAAEAARLRRLRRDIGVGCTSEAESPQSCCAMRESARGTLQRRVDDLRREAHQLELLSGSLPAVLTPEQDVALWSLLQKLCVRRS